jgi:hypothetical protein
MFHTLANFIAIGTTADTDVTPVQDDIVLIQNSHFVPPQDIQLLYSAAMSATLSRVKLSTPKTRVVTNPFIRPIIGAVKPASNPNIADYRLNPFHLRALEEISFLATSAIAMGTENLTIVTGLQISPDPMPPGDIFTLRGTSTTAAVANKWTSITVTWADNLPNGTYACVGSFHQSAQAQAHRLIFQGQNWRPGGLSMTNLTDRTPDMFVKGGLGVWGRFLQTAMPTPQVLCNAADAAHEVYLDLIRIQ